MKVVACTVADRMVTHLLETTQQKINQKQFIKKNMSLYSSQRMISLVNELGDQLLTLPNELLQFELEAEPIKIGEDTLMSLTNLQLNQQTSLQEEKAQTISDQHSTTRSNRNAKNIKLVMDNDKKSEKKEECDPNLHKLILNDDEDNQIAEIRKEKDRLFREQKQLQRRKQIHRQIKLHKDGFNFDYNGNIIEIKTDKKQNLISKLVSPHVPSEQLDRNKSDKAAKQKGTFVKTYQIKESDEGKPKKRNRQVQVPKQQEKNDVMFSKIKNPIQVIQVKEGVKATFNQSIVQKEKKKLTNEELLVSRSRRKLSKNEYERIKTSTLRSRPEPKEENNIEDLHQVEPIVNIKQIDDGPKYFSSNLKKRAVTESQGQKIRVEDIGLKRQLIEKIKQVESIREIRKVLDERPASSIKKEQLSRIDQYNLNYSRNKTQHSAMKKTIDNQSVLPKIKNKSEYSQPKLREKVKEASTIRREVMKKFEETLRV